jgi:hypothetical protein
MFCKKMPKIKKRRNLGLVNLRNFKGFRRESSEGEIAQTDQISELRDIPIEIRPDSPLDTGFLFPDNESILSFEKSRLTEARFASAVLYYYEGKAEYINYLNSIPEMDSFEISDKTDAISIKNAERAKKCPKKIESRKNYKF